ncbi:unnamed protein product [Caenorhabditis angaria]|uniref:G-protein coupled receptors family 1 profile domain-containing protein n=1 Tax=Caenorhabditis angaria TaxID=860376 RepID=A0A9P1N7D3_9PELO|nr:unnamed protein product [Caenorhabditis angaria]
MFPLFIHFTKINRERDKECSIFPITNHLYYITIISQVMILVTVCSMLSMILFNLFTSSVPNYIPVFTFITGSLVYAFNQIVVPIQNFLIFLLAFQRFIIYFYPRSEKFIIPGPKAFKCLLLWLYLISISGNFIYICFIAKCIDEFLKTHIYTCPKIYSTINSAIYISLDFLVIFSSIFYICIFISVRKVTRNSSSLMKTRLEKAILYQTLTLIIVKLLCFPMLYVSLAFLYIVELTLNSLMNAIYYPLFFIDVLTTPIVFQITYLFCNKTNLETLLKMNFRKLKTWMTICCGSPTNIVGNYHNMYSMSNAVTLSY